MYPRISWWFSGKLFSCFYFIGVMYVSACFRFFDSLQLPQSLQCSNHFILLLHGVHSIVLSSQYTLHTSNYTLYIANYTLHSEHCTLTTLPCQFLSHLKIPQTPSWPLNTVNWNLQESALCHCLFQPSLNLIRGSF